MLLQKVCSKLGQPSSLFLFNKPERAMQLGPPAETCLISGKFCNKEAIVGTAVWWQKQNVTLHCLNPWKKSVVSKCYWQRTHWWNEKCASRTQEKLNDILRWWLSNQDYESSVSMQDNSMKWSYFITLFFFIRIYFIRILRLKFAKF